MNMMGVTNSMIKIADLGRAACLSLCLAGFGLSAPASAQEASDAHLKAARAAIDAMGATDPFDNILPQIAERLKATLIQASPNFQDIIISTVDEKTLALAGRRGDLEREAASIYAKSFSEAELNAIADFFNSDVGKKFLKDMPITNRELYKAADVWGAGVDRDLAAESDKELEAIIGAKVEAGELPELAPKPEGEAAQ